MRKVKEIASIYVDKYESADGHRFDTEQECLNYEASLRFAHAAIQSIESMDCSIPFSAWDYEPDETKLYFFKNYEEYKILKDYHASKWGDDCWDEPCSYPAVYLAISKEGFSMGYEITQDHVKDFMDIAALMNEYLCKKEQS